jgi:hypothetical protein
MELKRGGVMNLIYIGRKFYSESSTIMSSIYDIEGRRQDWGSVERSLERGEEIHIRQASRIEMEHYEKELEKIKKERKSK